MPRAESIHLFAGAGGDTIAAEMAGVLPVLAANHWIPGVDTHALNYPAVDHVLGDLAIAEPKRFQRGFANVMFASPECDGHTSARNHREALRELRPWDPKSGIERSRCTMWCPQRWAAVHRFDVIVMENVVEVCRWAPFADWVAEWHKLGYRLQAVFANSAMFGAPQSRDRVYFIATPQPSPVPDLEFCPKGWCWHCEATVEGRQSWKPAALKAAGPVGPVGKYGPRAAYLYRCPTCKQVISPWVLPAWHAIDWRIVATRIRDRDIPLQPSTIARIERGLRRLGYMPARGPKDRPQVAAGPPPWVPLPAVVAGNGGRPTVPDGFQVLLRGTNLPRRFDDPAATVAASGNHTGLVTHIDPARPIGGPRPGETFVVANYNPGHVRDVSQEPLGTLTAGGQHGSPQQAIVETPDQGTLNAVGGDADRPPGSGPERVNLAVDAQGFVVPPEGFMVLSGGTRQQDIVDCSREPAPTRMPTENYGVVRPGFDVGDCSFRMVAASECQRFMGMHQRVVQIDGGSWEVRPFQLTGRNRDQVRMAGNGVTPQVEAPIVDRCLVAQGC